MAETVPAGSHRVPVASLPSRGRAHSSGYVQSITVVPATEAPRFTATVEDPCEVWRDPTETVARPKARLVWIGQRRVPGIEAGTQLVFEGMVCMVDGYPTVFNPRYEIVGRPESDA